MIDLLSLVIGSVFGVTMFGSWSVVLVRRILAWRSYRGTGDRRLIRARVGVLAAVGLWLTAVFFCGAMVLAVFVDLFDWFGPGSAGVLLGMGLGAFTGSGILAVLSDDR